MGRKEIKQMNEKTLYVVYNETLYNETGQSEILFKTESLQGAKRFCRYNKNLNYSTYPPFTYE